VDEGVGHRAALGDPGDVAAGAPRIDVADVDGAVGNPVDHAHAVRAEDCQAVAQGDLPNLALHPGRRRSALDDSPTGDQDASRADPGGFLGDARGSEWIESDQDAVGRLGQRRQVGVTGRAPGLPVFRVDEIAGGAAAHRQQVVADGLGDVRTGRRADDRDRSRREQRVEVDGRPIGRHASHAQARRVVVDQEERRQALLAVHDDRVEDHEVRVVRPRDEPLLAVQDVVAGGRIEDGAGGDRVRVRAGIPLGDRVAARALAPDRGVEIAPALDRVAVEQDVVGAWHVRPQAAGHLAELLVDDHLLHHGPALAADGLRQGSGMELAATAAFLRASPAARGSTPWSRSKDASRGWRTSTA
jgi:hypothetical protein